MINIAVFASGSGSNAERIFDYFKNNSLVNIKMFLTNNHKAFVIERAKKLNVQCEIFNKDAFYNSDTILNLLKNNNIDFIVLAGFLLLVPENLINQYPNKIVNIHPALLPKYGGKGMYGTNVHKAVKDAGESETGISIHFVNKKYDEGAIIFQASCVVDKKDSVDDIASKIHELEYEHFPKVLQKVLLKLL
ncbi:MAG TPA: phosphoribosylglycinamide formyltransferase [Bacteroidales bacterium]|nr:MAG: phosphoribosylglycinamide formyltransferase [Bacteroidetes bacterium GWF2_33_38]OFY91851.1 MAG: phosphoribosylglycinamide formyltransferase [Bacteroidetes bacterium RIFOXYA2_FULL_33_7]HBF87709.1 phosphoribosylglycinamide formyltransferase [Bacteroidales bacterium]